jgi:hypothetical protein
MNIDKRWLFATAALGAAAGAAVTSQLLRRRQVQVQHRDDAADLKTWESKAAISSPIRHRRGECRRSRDCDASLTLRIHAAMRGSFT